MTTRIKKATAAELPQPSIKSKNSNKTTTLRSTKTPLQNSRRVVKKSMFPSKLAWYAISNDQATEDVIHFVDASLRDLLAQWNVISYHMTDDHQSSLPVRQRTDCKINITSLYDTMERTSHQMKINHIDQVTISKIENLCHFLAAHRQSLARQTVDQYLQTQQVHFDSLPYLFSPGQTVLVSINDQGLRMGAQITQCSIHQSMFGRFALIQYRYLNHDGQRWQWQSKDLRLSDFGTRHASSLPIQWMSEAQTASFVERGQTIMDMVKNQHFYAFANGMLERPQYFFTERMHCNSRAMISRLSCQIMEPNFDGYFDGEVLEQVPVYLPGYQAPESFEDCDCDDDHHTSLSTPQDARAFICPYVYGFSFQHKKWGRFNVSDLKPVEFRDDAFDRLVLDSTLKTTVEALVRSHHEVTRQDLIDHKGGGLVFLLHGSPGVGKTLTAESIAETLHRPLYMVSAGELGTTPDELESRLQKIFQLATSWNAVMLIDEADIFMQARNDDDILRNAMVGIFLRQIEYYQGILFLTTNRLKNIDQAFFSRISMGIHYDALNDDSRLSIWKQLLALAQISLNELELQSLMSYSINGRQIKQAIFQAQSLAHHRQAHSLPSFHDLKLILDHIQSFQLQIQKS